MLRRRYNRRDSEASEALAEALAETIAHMHETLQRVMEAEARMIQSLSQLGELFNVDEQRSTNGQELRELDKLMGWDDA